MQEVMEKPVTDEQEAAQRVIEVINVAPKAIKTEEQYTEGMLWLKGVVVRRKKIEEFFESLKAPIRKALKAVQDKEKSILSPLEEEQAKLKKLTGDYYMKKLEEERKKQAEENRKHQEKIDAAIAKGKDPITVAPPKVIEKTPPKSITTDNGGPGITMRLIKNWRVAKAPQYCQQSETKIYRCDHPELQAIPDQCWVLDTARANVVAKSGMSPALELYDVPSQAVR